jgi:ABC-type sugar transport system substrate-binding protein
MANRKATVTQAEITRALRAARDAGIPVARFEIGRDGKVIIIAGDPGQRNEPNPWDQP